MENFVIIVGYCLLAVVSYVFCVLKTRVSKSLRVSNYSLRCMQLPNPTHSELLQGEIPWEWPQDVCKSF